MVALWHTAPQNLSSEEVSSFFIPFLNSVVTLESAYTFMKTADFILTPLLENNKISYEPDTEQDSLKN